MKTIDFYKKAMCLAIPIMVQNGITNMVGLVDNVMVGTLGTEQMTAVSIINQLLFVNSLAIFGAVSGPGIYCAQFFGQGNKEGVRHTFHYKLLICTMVAIAAFLILLTNGSALFNLYLHGSGGEFAVADTIKYGKEYLAVMLATLLPFALTQVYASTMRETGKTMMPMIAGLISVAVDVVFNYLLIFGKFGFPKLGVTGAAIATVLARIVELAIILIGCHGFSSRFPYMKCLYRTFRIPKELMKEMTKKGMPIFINEFLWAGGIAALTQCYSMRGLQVVAGLNISNTLCNIFNVVFVSMGAVVGIMVGQCLGASEFEEAKLTSKRLRYFSAAISGAVAVILIACSGLFPKAYDTTQSVRALAQQFMIITAIFFPVQGYLNAVYFTIRSGGKTFITFLFDSVYSWVVCVPVAFLICRFTGAPILLVYIVVQALDIIKSIIGYILLKKGVWMQNLVI